MADYKYVQATVNISNAVPGQKLSVVLVPDSSDPSDQVAWSTGEPMKASSTGIQLSATGGVAVPVTSFSVNGTTIVAYTSSDGGGSGSLTLTVSAYLVMASGLKYINIKSDTSPGPVVTFQFPGEQPITLSQTTVAIKVPS